MNLDLIRSALADPDVLMIGKREAQDLLSEADQLQTEHDKLLAYARTVTGRRDVHSVYEVLDEVARLRTALDLIRRGYANPVTLASDALAGNGAPTGAEV